MNRHAMASARVLTIGHVLAVIKENFPVRLADYCSVPKTTSRIEDVYFQPLDPKPRFVLVIIRHASGSAKVLFYPFLLEDLPEIHAEMMREWPRIWAKLGNPTWRQRHSFAESRPGEEPRQIKLSQKAQDVLVWVRHLDLDQNGVPLLRKKVMIQFPHTGDRAWRVLSALRLFKTDDGRTYVDHETVIQNKRKHKWVESTDFVPLE